MQFFDRVGLFVFTSALLASLAVFGCSQTGRGDGEELAEAKAELARTADKLAETEAQLAAAKKKLAEVEEQRGHTNETPKPDRSAHKAPRCRALSHDAKPPRTPLAKLAERHPGVLMGIDVSHYDGRPDWSQVAASKVSFVYIKATQGTGFHDPCFHLNAEGASENGLLWSAYHILDPRADGVKQAEVFLKAVGDRKYTLPLVLDIENHLVEGHPVADVTDKISKWLAYVEKQAGHKPMLYVGHALVRSYFKEEWHFGDHRVWFADYNHREKPNYFKSLPAWTIWQFTDDGEVQGIRSALDVNLYRGTREQLAAILKQDS